MIQVIFSQVDGILEPYRKLGLGMGETINPLHLQSIITNNRDKNTGNP